MVPPEKPNRWKPRHAYVCEVVVIATSAKQAEAMVRKKFKSDTPQGLVKGSVRKVD